MNFYIFKLYEKGIKYVLNKLKNCDERQTLIKDGKIKIITEIKKEEKRII